MPVAQTITLQEWDALRFSKPHSLSTLRKWAREGYIQPQPTLVGTRYEVDPEAQYTPPQSTQIRRLRLAQHLRGANLVDSINAAHNDPEMLEILSHGRSP